MTLPKFSTSLAEQAGIGPRSRLDYQSIQRLLALIEARFLPLEGSHSSMDELANDLRGVALSRINDVLVPAIQSVIEMQERGFLIAYSETPGTLGTGNILTLNVGDATERRMFSPSPRAILSRVASEDDFAVVRTISFDKESGDYICQVIWFAGAAGPHADWVIGALAGSTVAQQMMLATAEDVQADIAEKHAAVMDATADLSAVIEAIRQGPVVSVNGETGAVNVTPALIGAAAASHGHGINSITGLSEALAQKADAAAVSTALSGKASTISVSGLATIVAENAANIDGGTF